MQAESYAYTSRTKWVQGSMLDSRNTKNDTSAELTVFSRRNQTDKKPEDTMETNEGERQVIQTQRGREIILKEGMLE